MGVRGQSSDRGRMVLPRGGSGTARGVEDTSEINRLLRLIGDQREPAPRPTNTSCDGCGAAVVRSVCPYCERHARREQLGSLAVVDDDPRRTAQPQVIKY